jgi:hypothetical protein
VHLQYANFALNNAQIKILIIQIIIIAQNAFLNVYYAWKLSNVEHALKNAFTNNVQTFFVILVMRRINIS